jgi:hypothetical protein
MYYLSSYHDAHLVFGLDSCNNPNCYGCYYYHHGEATISKVGLGGCRRCIIYRLWLGEPTLAKIMNKAVSGIMFKCWKP